MLPLLVLFTFISLVFTEEPPLEKMTFKAPDLNEEETSSQFMPEHMKCDACVVVAYQLTLEFAELYKRYAKHNGNAPESDAISAAESACQHSKFRDYGVKQVNGITRLSGPPLDTENTPGVMAGGGRWPNRLVDMCVTFAADEFDELELYEMYKNQRNMRTLEEVLCHSSEKGRNYCSVATAKPTKKNRNEL